MRLTMINAEALLEAIENLESASANIQGPLEEWRDLDGETDEESRDYRRDAREAVEDNMDDLKTAVADLAKLLKVSE